MASPSVVQSVPKTTTATTTALQLTGLSTTAGNLYLLTIAIRTAGTGHVTSVTDSAGNTWAKQTSGASGTAAVAEIWATTNDSPAAITSVTVNLDAALSLAFRFVEISGAVNSFPNIGVKGAGGSTAAINTGATPAMWPALSLVIAATASAQSTQDYTAAQAFTAGTPTVVPSTTTGDFSNVAGSEMMLQTAYLQLNTTSAQTYTETMSTGHAWGACELVIPGATTPRVVGHASKLSGGASVNTLQLTGLSTIAGNLYAVLVGASNGTANVSSVTDSAGNTWTRRLGANAANTDCELWTTSDSSPSAITTVTVNMTTACRYVFEFIEIAGADNASPVDTSSTATGTSNTPSSGASGTPAAKGLALAGIDTQLGNNPFLTAQSFTSANPPDSHWIPTATSSDLSTGGAGQEADLMGAWLLDVTAAQTWSGTVNSGAVNWACFVAVIKAAAVSTTALEGRPTSALQAVNRAGGF